jgi:MFS family permease
MSRMKRAKGAAELPSFLTQVRLLTARLSFLLVSLISFMNSVVRTGALFALIPLLATDVLGLSVSAVGFAMMMGSVTGLAAAYPSGWLADRYGRKTVIVPSTVMAGLSMILFCYAPSYPWFVAASIAWGVAISIGAAAPAAYAADSAPEGMNAAAVSTFRMMGDAGYMIGPLALGLVADLYGAVTAIIISAALMVMVGLAFGLFAVETYAGRGR